MRIPIYYFAFGEKKVGLETYTHNNTKINPISETSSEEDGQLHYC